MTPRCKACKQQHSEQHNKDNIDKHLNQHEVHWHTMPLSSTITYSIDIALLAESIHL